MTSQAQQKKGYPLPENVAPSETQSFCVTIPAGDEFRNAMLGQLLELGQWWKWKRSEALPVAATQTALTWREMYSIEEDCGGDNMATVEEICEGVTCAIEKAAKAILLGINASPSDSLTINPDGSVEVASGEAPADDPTTTDLNEQWAAEMGGSIAIAKGLELFFDRLDTYYGATNGTPVQTADFTKANIKAYFPSDPEMDAAIDYYYTYRATNGRFLFDTSDTFEQYLFCNGHNELAFNRWLIDSSGYADAKQTAMRTTVLGLSQEFWDDTYSSGLDTPSTEYRAAACTPFDTETITFSGADFTGSAYKTGSVINKNNHRVLLEVEGKVPDTAGGIQDFFWRLNPDGTKSFLGSSTSNGTWQVNSNWTAPTPLEVPYRADGKYKVTRDTVASGATFLSIRRKLTESGSGGQFTMKITDLGQI